MFSGIQNLIKTFFGALLLGIVVFCLVALFNANQNRLSVNWKKNYPLPPVARNNDTPSTPSAPPPSTETTMPPISPSGKPPRGLDTLSLPNATAENPPAQPDSESAEVLISDRPATHSAFTPPTMPFFSPEGDYQIQLGLLQKGTAKWSDYQDLQSLGELEIDLNGAANRITLGNYFTKSHADAVLKHVRQLGYKDAFITTQKQTPQERLLQKPAVFADITPQNADAYIIKLGTFSQPPFELLNKLSEKAGKVYLQPDKEGLFKVFLGSYSNKPIAEKQLPQVKKIGFTDALVVNAEKDEVAHRVLQSSSQVGKGLMIQLSASKIPPLASFRQLNTLGAIYTEYDPKHRLTKVLLGPFENQKSVENALSQVRNKGFECAFIKQGDWANDNQSRVKVIEKAR